MTALASDRIHASCVARENAAILIVGRSGAGKSDLAMRLIDRGAILVSDDSTQLDRAGDAVLASAPATIAGKIELYGVGIVELPACRDVPVRLIVSLDEPPTRMPDYSESRAIVGIDIPVIAIDGREAGAAIKVEFALRKVLA